MEGSSSRCYGISSALSRARNTVLVLGSGGREHALAWQLRMSAEVSCVFVAPGNGGMATNADGLSSAPVVSVDVPLQGPDFADVIAFCKREHVGLVVVGPEQLLADGVADQLRANSIR